MPGLTIEQAFKMYQEFCQEAIPICEEKKIKIAINPSRHYNPLLAIDLYKKIDSPYFTIAPDLEAWRLKTDDFPLIHAERPGQPEAEPLPISLFEECLPFSPVIHFKTMGFDEKGDDFHFPIKEIMTAIKQSNIDHYLVVEYEGWIPELNPHLNPVKQTKMAVDMIYRHYKG